MQQNIFKMPDRRKRFSDFSSETFVMDGEKIAVDQILNREIEIIGFRISDSKFNKNGSGKCLTIQLMFNGNLYVCFTGSSVLIAQLEKYSEEIPFLTIIKKQFKYFTMT